MIDYRTYLTGLVAVFLALGLGMLIGAALVGSPSTQRQQKELRTLQDAFKEFRQQNSVLRTQCDDVKARLTREDQALRDMLPSFVAGKLSGRRVAVVLCGEIEDTSFLSSVSSAIQEAGGSIASTTRVADDWLPVDPESRSALASALGVSSDETADSKLAAALGYAVAAGRSERLADAARAASGLRLDGDYARPSHAVLLITGAATSERQNTARLGLTPESALLSGIAGHTARVVVAEPDGDEALSVVSYFAQKANATVDNVNMVAGQLSAVYALAGRDGRFGIKRSAERALPEL